jgi:hypothetical protein
MDAPPDQDRSCLAVRNEALLLTGGESPRQIKNAAKVLGFFGIPWHTLHTIDFFAFLGSRRENSAKLRLICSADTFVELLARLAVGSERIRHWRQQVHSAFVYAGQDSGVLLWLARELAGDRKVELKENQPWAGDFVISSDLKDFCGVMSGVRITASKSAPEAGLTVRASTGKALKIISAGDCAAFIKIEHEGVPVFLSTAARVIDIDAELPTGVFDVRDHILPAVPIVLYVKWAFRGTCWNAPETNACLIIDDPLLKPTYGFVDYHQLLSLMKQHRFSTNIAFIPMNWRRSHPDVVRLFKENEELYSLSVHGCDHIRVEFGSSDPQRLYWKSRQALERMSRHESKTGIHHDRVMVFPQGVFSESGMKALKHTDFIAATNNDTLSTDLRHRAITVSEVWDVAVMRYHNFPIFTRRYPWAGMENFAFDALLGKPVLAVIHHDFCDHECLRLVDFIQRLNALNCRLKWGSLGEVVRRSCRQREVRVGLAEIEMYATELMVENCSQQTKRLVIKRREVDPSWIKDIQIGSRPIAWEFSGNHIRFEVELESGESSAISVRFRGLRGNEGSKEDVSYQIRTRLRRHLCEVRDNYFMKYAPGFISQRFKVN